MMDRLLNPREKGEILGKCIGFRIEKDSRNWNSARGAIRGANTRLNKARIHFKSRETDFPLPSVSVRAVVRFHGSRTTTYRQVLLIK